LGIKNKIFILVSLLSACMLVTGQLQAETVSDTDLVAINRQALDFMSESGFPVQENVSIKFDAGLKYYGYTHPADKKISLMDGLTVVQSKITLVHEYAHRFRYQYNPHEKLWLSEGLAQMFEYFFRGRSWPIAFNDLVFNRQRIVISDAALDFAPQAYGYPSSFIFLNYLYTHFGQEKFLQKVMRSEKSGWANIISAIIELQLDGRLYLDAFFQDIDINNFNAKNTELIERIKFKILRHFAVALIMNDAYLSLYSLYKITEPQDGFKKLSDPELNLYTSEQDFPALADHDSDNDIIFSKKYFKAENIKAQEGYTIKSFNPLEIVKADSLPDGGLVYFFIR
jgi:hypothetical protein